MYIEKVLAININCSLILPFTSYFSLNFDNMLLFLKKYDHIVRNS